MDRIYEKKKKTLPYHPAVPPRCPAHPLGRRAGYCGVVGRIGGFWGESAGFGELCPCLHARPALPRSPAPQAAARCLPGVIRIINVPLCVCVWRWVCRVRVRRSLCPSRARGQTDALRFRSIVSPGCGCNRLFPPESLKRETSGCINFLRPFRLH